jgi:hypothetical protein
MIQTIKKGKHRPGNWWKCIRLWHNKKSITRLVRFDFTARYDLPAGDGEDLNKLFGLGYFWNKKDSARFCWKWNEATQRVGLYAYYHVAGMKDSRNVNGPMDFKYLFDLNRSLWYRLELQITDEAYKFTVSNLGQTIEFKSLWIPKHHKKKWNFYLGLYFGGNRTAPHPITVEIKK